MLTNGHPQAGRSEEDSPNKRAFVRVRRFCLVLALHRPGPTGPLPGWRG
jgi:hypothetical protein